MTENTALDAAHAAMQAAPEDAGPRMRFYDRLADSELFLLLAGEAQGDAVEPETFEVDGARYVLVFDREERLAEFTGRLSPYAGLSGRAVAAMLAGQEIGLAVNPEVAPSSILIPPEAVDWLARTLAQGPAQAEARPSEVRPPSGLPDALLSALDGKLASARGLARMAYLAGVTYADDSRGHLLGFIDAAPGAEAALAGAINEALTFSGIEAGALDVTFLAASDPLAAALARHGLRFDVPQPEAAPARRAPGSDPDKPPILR